MTHGAAERLVVSSLGARSYRRGVLVLGSGFLGVFACFSTAQGLQTSLNATLGFVNLAAVYGTFTLLCLVAPPVVALLDATVGLRIALLAAGLAYAPMAFANIDEGSWALPISTSTLLGAAAPLLWTCSNDYLGRCAYHTARAEEATDPAACSGLGQGGALTWEERLAATTTAFNGLFYSFYQTAGMLGNVLASCWMLALGGGSAMTDVLFCVLGCVGVAGAMVFLFLPRVGATGPASERASLTDTAALALSDARMGLLIPLIFTNGMTISYMVGDFPASIVSPVAGPKFVGFVAAAFYGANAASTALWAHLISRGAVSRRSAYLGAVLIVVAVLAAATLWPNPTNFEKRGDTWEQVSEPRVLDVLLVFLLAASFAVGDSFMESGPTATLQNYFLGSRAVVPAMANTNLWQSLGYTTQFLLGACSVGTPAMRAALLAGLMVLSAGCLLILDRRAPVH